MHLEVRAGLKNLALDIVIGMDTLLLFMDTDFEAQQFLLLHHILHDWTFSIENWRGYILNALSIYYRDWNGFAQYFWQTFFPPNSNNFLTKWRLNMEVTGSKLSNLPLDSYPSYMASLNLSNLVTFFLLENTTSSDSFSTSSSSRHVPVLRSIDRLSLSLHSWFTFSDDTNHASVSFRSFNVIISALFRPSMSQCQHEVYDAMDDIVLYRVVDDTNLYFVLPWIISMMSYVILTWDYFCEIVDAMIFNPLIIGAGATIRNISCDHLFFLFFRDIMRHHYYRSGQGLTGLCFTLEPALLLRHNRLHREREILVHDPRLVEFLDHIDVHFVDTTMKNTAI